MLYISRIKLDNSINVCFVLKFQKKQNLSFNFAVSSAIKFKIKHSKNTNISKLIIQKTKNHYGVILNFEQDVFNKFEQNLTALRTNKQKSTKY